MDDAITTEDIREEMQERVWSKVFPPIHVKIAESIKKFILEVYYLIK